MESQEKKHVQKGRDKAISFNFAITFFTGWYLIWFSNQENELPLPPRLQANSRCRDGGLGGVLGQPRISSRQSFI